MTRLRLAFVALLFLLLAAPLSAQGSDGFLVGVSKSWTRTAPNIEARLDIAEALGADALQVSTTLGGFTGSELEMERAAVITDAAGARDIRVLLAVGGRLSAIRELTPAAVRAGGAAWGRWAASRLDDLVGFSVLNEVNLTAQRLERRDGAAAAEAVIQHEVELTVAFAEGVRSECSRCVVLHGGLGGRELNQDFEYGVRFMEVLAPYVRSGLIGGLDTHWYRAGRAFDFSRDAAGNLRARWKEDPSAIVNDLLVRAGWPRDTDLYMTEVNVRQSTFRSPEQAGAALEAMLNAFNADPRARAAFVFTPYYNENRDNDVARNYVVRVDTPVGDAVRAASRRSGGSAGGPGGSADAGGPAAAEAPWYCRLLGIGCR